ncbi:hypothetical protein HNR16_001695 [Pseudoclavibacter chungangensis]|uniref:hypothetical protein n=1 Tax=Pseudoclavibacter chungangensis TaxID=587635 RepID=UPI001820C891|nr:hypothetical protein [Pseudoclavibacter chungangensis]NYJ66907.1 hypothetical protein [Pseudoclavibacter chungangensis]
MFSAATASAASGLGANALVAVAGQNVAGSYAMLASPPRVALAVGVALPAGERLPAWAPRVLLGAVLVAVVVLGALVALFA